MLISYRRIRCQTPFPHSLSERIQPHAELPTKPLKARPARHLQSRSIRRRIPKQSARPDGWRFLTGVKDVAEWEGIWESSDGHVFFLEAKHLMDVGKLPEIRHKLTKSLDFLGLDRSKATVYLAGNHWSDDAMEVGQSSVYRFGILTSNGNDLSVRDPPRLELG